MIDLRYDNMTCTAVWTAGGDRLPPIVNLANGPFPAGTRPLYAGMIVDRAGVGLNIADYASATLTIVDVLTGEVINGVDHVDVLNTGRGTFSDGGGFEILLDVADTLMDEVPGAPQVTRALILDWATTAVPPEVGRHQANFVIVRLADQ